MEPFQGSPNEVGDGTCPVGKCSMLGACLRGFAAKATFQAGCDYYPERVSVTTDAEGSAEVLTRCYAGNTNVGMVVDGVGAWGQFDVAYAR